MLSDSSHKNAHVANVLLVGIIIVASITWWRELPQRIPVHFDLAGNVDRWGSKGAMWWAFSALAIVGTGLVYGFAHLSRRYPQLVNLPRRIRLMDLPEDLRDRVMSLSRGMIYWLAVAMNLTWLLLLAAVREAAQGVPQNAAMLVFGTLGIAVVVVPLILLRFYVRLKRIAGDARR